MIQKRQSGTTNPTPVVTPESPKASPQTQPSQPLPSPSKQADTAPVAGPTARTGTIPQTGPEDTFASNLMLALLVAFSIAYFRSKQVAETIHYR